MKNGKNINLDNIMISKYNWVKSNTPFRTLS